MKTKFEYIEAQLEVIVNYCNDADDFAITWKKFLEYCGWTEEEYQKELYFRQFSEHVN
jgi:hypothetical protein